MIEQIIRKLSVQNTDLRYYYFINNVLVGLELALKHEKITGNQDLYDCLVALNKKARKIPLPTWDEVDLKDQLVAYHIGLDALVIIKEVV